MSWRHNLTITEALKYLQQLSEDDSESDYNDDCLSIWRDEYLPPNEGNYNSDEENYSDDDSASALTIAGSSHPNGDDKLSVLNKNSSYWIR